MGFHSATLEPLRASLCFDQKGLAERGWFRVLGAFGCQELRVRILTEAEAADRYLLSGPVCYQAAVPLGAEVNEVKLGVDSTDANKLDMLGSVYRSICLLSICIHIV